MARNTKNDSPEGVRTKIRALRGTLEQVGLYLDDLNDEIRTEDWDAADYQAVAELLDDAIDHANQAEDAARDAAGKEDPDDE